MMLQRSSSCSLIFYSQFILDWALWCFSYCSFHQIFKEKFSCYFESFADFLISYDSVFRSLFCTNAIHDEEASAKAAAASADSGAPTMYHHLWHSWFDHMFLKIVWEPLALNALDVPYQMSSNSIFNRKVSKTLKSVW